MEKVRAIVLLSGGLDSAVALYWARSQGWELFPIEFEYHGRPESERGACQSIRERAGIPRQIVVPIPFIREVSDMPRQEIANSALLGAPQGYIPVRNLVFYALSSYHAEILGARWIVGGHNRTDCESFPDAAKDFWQQMNRVLEISMWSHSQIQSQIVLPLLEMEKVDVLRLGVELGVPFDLTWSCYYDIDSPCGACESCAERQQALVEAGIPPD